MRKPIDALRAGATRAWDKGGELAVWAMCNRRKALCIAGVALAGIFVTCSLVRPGEANAIIPAIPIAASIIGLVGAGAFAAGNASDMLNDLMSGALRDLILALLGWCETLVMSTATGELLTSTFETLLNDRGIHDALFTLHHAAVIPLGNIVATTFLVFGLVKIISKAGQTDAGIDVWQFVMLFVFYGAATTLVNASWEIMYSLFQLGNALIGKLLITAQSSIQLADPTANINNSGMLFAMLIATLIVCLVTLLVCGLSHAVVIIRAIQIYLYTVFSPIPLAMLVSEGGREMTKSFFKKYAALLLSGALLVILFYMFSLALAAIPFPQVELDESIGSFAVWATMLVLNYLVFYGAFGYAVFKSGAWARDLLGI